MECNYKFQNQKTEQNILEHNLANEHEYDYSDDDEEDQDPVPKWNIPNWQGNHKADTNKKCEGCITRIQNGLERGCEECDEFWDMPELDEYNDFYDKPDDMNLAERIYAMHEREYEEENKGVDEDEYED